MEPKEPVVRDQWSSPLLPPDAMAVQPTGDQAVAVPSADEPPVIPPTAPAPSTINTLHNQVNVNVAMPAIHFNAVKTGPSFIVRALWWLFIGWWLSLVVAVVGWALIATLILMPLGIWLIHRLPQAQTLRARTRSFTTEFRDGAIVFTESTIPQRPWYWRVLYTICCGLWVGAAWIMVAWAIGLTVVLLPLSIWMIDRAPGVTTLQRH